MGNRENQLIEIIEGAVETGVVPGASLVVVEGGDRVDIIRGVADPTGTELALDTVGRYYSSVKAVTSAVVLSLVDEGRLELDEPISSLLPEWSERRAVNGIPTVEHLLTHTAGLTYQAWESGPHVHPIDASYRDAGIDHEGTESLEAFSAKLAQQPLCFLPGQRWRYSLAHDLLGRVIEQVTAAPVAEVFNSRIFEPLGMDSSGFVPDPQMVARLGACWRHIPNAEPSLELVDNAGAASTYASGERIQQMVSCGGGLLSTIDDYVTFLLMLRNDGVHRGQRILSAFLVDKMMTDQLAPMLASDQRDARFRVCTATGFGFGGEVARDGTGWFGWGGYGGTSFVVDRRADRVAALQLQVQNDFTITVWDDLMGVLLS